MEDEINLKEVLYYFLDKYKKILNIVYIIFALFIIYFIAFKMADIIFASDILIKNMIIECVKSLAIYAVISIILSCCYYFAKYCFDSSIKSEYGVERLTNSKIFGVMLNSKDTRSIKNIRSNIYINSKKNKVILVTRPFDEKHQSRLIYYLANEYALSNKKVLILDMDLNSNNQSKLFKINNEVGYTDIINKLDNLDKAINKTDNNVDVIVNGKVNGDPIEILMDINNKKLFTELSSKYDIILVDAPYILGTTGVLQLTKHSDFNLLVIENEKTTGENFSRSIKLLEDKNIGVVVTNVSEKSKNYFEYSKKYYYDK